MENVSVSIPDCRPLGDFVAISGVTQDSRIRFGHKLGDEAFGNQRNYTNSDSTAKTGNYGKPHGYSQDKLEQGLVI